MILGSNFRFAACDVTSPSRTTRATFDFASASGGASANTSSAVPFTTRSTLSASTASATSFLRVSSSGSLSSASSAP